MGVINNQVRIDELERQIASGGGGGGGSTAVEVKKFSNVIKTLQKGAATINVNAGEAYVYGNVVVFTEIVLSTPLDFDWTTVPYNGEAIILNFSDEFFLNFDIAGAVAGVGKISVYTTSTRTTDIFATVRVAPTSLNPYLFLQLNFPAASIPESLQTTAHCNSIILPAIIVATKNA